MQVCPVCKKSSFRGRTHEGRCQGKTHLTGLIVAAKYTTNPVLEKTIRQFKYHYSVELTKELGVILFEAMGKNFSSLSQPPQFRQEAGQLPLKSLNLWSPPLRKGVGEQDTVIVPIPLHPSRKRWRGFNQAELLAREVGVQANIPVLSLLERRRKTRQQARLSREERLENVKGAFEISERFPATSNQEIPPAPLYNGGVPRRILLVDDVASTLATLEEAAKVLREAGFEDVTGLVLARG